MNPFDLRGPQFLAFYAALTPLTLLVIWWLRRNREMGLQDGGAVTPAALADPYLIAYLRGGASETIRTAAVSLIDRGLLTVEGEKVHTSSTGRKTDVRRTVERALLEYCAASSDPRGLFKDQKLVAACDEYEQQLTRRHLLPDEAVTANRKTIFNCAVAVLIAFSIVKLIVAFMRGRSNVMFLIVCTIIAVVAAHAVAFPRQTALGKALLSEIQNLFSALKLRAAQIRPGGATAEMSLLVAVFGISALQGADFAWTKLLFPAAAASDSSSSSGSSCGSSCGGGCGGGCEGCGG